LKKCTTNGPFLRRISRPAEPLNHTRSSASHASSMRFAQVRMSASAFSRRTGMQCRRLLRSAWMRSAPSRLLLDQKLYQSAQLPHLGGHLRRRSIASSDHKPCRHMPWGDRGGGKAAAEPPSRLGHYAATWRTALDPGWEAGRCQERDGQCRPPVTKGSCRKERSMRMFSLILVMLLAAAPLLSACHTVEGAGQDISSTGRAVQRHM